MAKKRMGMLLRNEATYGACGLAATDFAVEREALGPGDELEGLELGALPVGGHFRRLQS